MSRMYSRKKGKSGSKKPMVKKAPWVKHKPEEIEEMILKLAKKGMQSSEIGTVLRDQYGIPSTRLINKTKISGIMKKHSLYSRLPEDLYNLIQKAVNLDAHMKKNKRDYISTRGLELTESKIRRLAKYYKKRKMIEQGWAWNIETAKLMVK